MCVWTTSLKDTSTNDPRYSYDFHSIRFRSLVSMCFKISLLLGKWTFFSCEEPKVSKIKPAILLSPISSNLATGYRTAGDTTHTAGGVCNLNSGQPPRGLYGTTILIYCEYRLQILGTQNKFLN